MAGILRLSIAGFFPWAGGQWFILPLWHLLTSKRGENMKRGKHSASGKRQSRKRAKSN
jgi:hypothetical protein